jgi:hypothetical protein
MYWKMRLRTARTTAGKIIPPTTHFVTVFRIVFFAMVGCLSANAFSIAYI